MEEKVRSHPSGLSHKYCDPEEVTVPLTPQTHYGEAQMSFLCRRGAQWIPG